MLKTCAKDFSQYIDGKNFDRKLRPLNRSVEEILARMEEFETMLSFVQPDIRDSKDILTSLVEYKPEFDKLCTRIDSVEFLVEHVKNNLDSLEAEFDKYEAKMGYTDAASKLSNIFTPLFKKNIEKKPTSPGATTELFKSEDYFQ